MEKLTFLLTLERYVGVRQAKKENKKRKRRGSNGGRTTRERLQLGVFWVCVFIMTCHCATAEQT